MKLKIMTYNIASGHTFEHVKSAEEASGRQPYDLSKCAGVIASIAPDICGMNEVDNYMSRSGWVSQTEQIGEHTGMKGFFGKAISFDSEPKGEYGNAVLSKFPILEAEAISIPDPERKDEHAYYETRGVTRVKLDVNGTPVTVLQTHFGLAISEQQNAQMTLLKLLDQTEGPVILMGDFNIRPNNFLLNPIRERLQDTAALADGYFKTFPSCPSNYPDCKIDYVFVSSHFKPLRLEIPQTKASDHLPYVVEVEL